ncbi:MAG: phosphopantetheine-binding protein, partial [Saprospiraceae bacterium]
RQAEYVAPTTTIETQLVEIWQEVLGVEQIGILDNFFDLGGNSLNAIRINAKIRQELDLELEIKNLFHLKTIRDLAFQIDFSEQQKEIKLDNQTLRKIEL